MLVHLMLSQRFLRLLSFLFILFFYILFCQQWFPPFYPPGHLSILLPQLFCYWFIFVCLFFSSSRSLANISCIFFVVFPRSWSVFIIIILNSFSERLPVSTSVSCFGSVSCGVTTAFPWVLVHARFCLCPLRLESLFSPVLWKSYNQILLAFKVRFPGDS